MTFRVEYALKETESGSSLKADPGADDLFGYVLQGFLLSIVCIVGILANILTIMVLSRKEMQSPVNYLLMNLAISDMFFLFAQGLSFGVYNLCKLFGIFNEYRFHYDPLITPAMVWATVSG